MTPPYLVTALPLQEFGFAAGVTGGLLMLFIWFVRAARHDVRSTAAQARIDARNAADLARLDVQAAAERARRTSAEFTDYLKTTSGEQTRVLIGVANVLERSLMTMDKHDEHATGRHAEIMRELRKAAAARHEREEA